MTPLMARQMLMPLTMAFRPTGLGRATSARLSVATDRTLMVVDGHAIAYRMHFALVSTGLSTLDGEPTHALSAFCSKMLDLHSRFERPNIVVAWDLPGGAALRTAELPSYKASRPAMPMALRTQIIAMRDWCEVMGVPALTAEGYEADDIIATCVAAARARGAPSVVVVTPDKDMLQLVSDGGTPGPTTVSVWNDAKKVPAAAKGKGKGAKGLLFDAAAVMDQYGVRPSQMGDLLALMGDASDNIPGVPGVGPKIAAKLLVEYGDLEGVLAAALTMKQSKRQAALIEHTDVARRARRLVALCEDVPLDPHLTCGAPLRTQMSDEARAFLERWELRRTASAIETLEREHPTAQ